jgi:hypothetical protein
MYEFIQFMHLLIVQASGSGYFYGVEIKINQYEKSSPHIHPFSYYLSKHYFTCRTPAGRTNKKGMLLRQAAYGYRSI